MQLFLLVFKKINENNNVSHEIDVYMFRPIYIHSQFGVGEENGVKKYKNCTFYSRFIRLFFISYCFHHSKKFFLFFFP